MEYYWYFSGNDCRLRYGDGREISVGATHTVSGDPLLCQHGLHASARLIDALQYAPGNILWLVSLGGTVVISDDKCVASERTYYAKLDAEQTLREFSHKIALSVSHLWDAPQIVLRYLRTGDESLRAAARAAAWAAAWAAARDAAWAAANKKLTEMILDRIDLP